MDKTAITTKPLPSVAPPTSEARELETSPSKTASAQPWRILYVVLQAIGSLKVTAWLFALSIPLVWFGTMAQADASLLSVIWSYFRSFYVWVPLHIFVKDLPGGFPYPGGWFLGALLLVNLLAAHSMRFRSTFRHPGIILIHTGVIVIMVSEFWTGLVSVESHMTIEEGKTANYVEETGVAELAIGRKLEKKADDKEDQEEVTVIPQHLLRRKEAINHELLPFEIQVDQYMVNSALVDVRGADKANPATQGQGLRFLAREKREGTGADTDQKVDVPSAYITLKRKDNGQTIGTFLVSNWLSMTGRLQKVEVDGETYHIALRPRRSYRDYSIELIKFTQELYPNTKTPKRFESRVRIIDSSHDENRVTVISMNAPMTYRSETFYQSSFLPGDAGTVLQVVYNPSKPLPYAGFFMVMAGMVFHFGLKLVRFAQHILAQRRLA